MVKRVRKAMAEKAEAAVEKVTREGRTKVLPLRKKLMSLKKMNRRAKLKPRGKPSHSCLKERRTNISRFPSI